MNWKTAVPLIVAIVLGTMAAILGREILQRRIAGTPEREQAAVVTVSRDLDPGEQIQADDLSINQLPMANLPPSAIRNPQGIVGRVVAVPVAKGQTLVESSLAPPNSGLGLQALLPHGMRAVTVEVSEFAGMEGLLMPGCHVDVLATLADETTHQSVTRTIVQDVTVSAIGVQTAAKPANTDPARSAAKVPKGVTVIVTPRQAEAIELAATRGRPRLVLRAAHDDTPAQTPGVTVAELINMAPPASPKGQMVALSDVVSSVKLLMASFPTAQSTPAPPVERPTPPPVIRRTIQIIKGGVESTKTFDMIPIVENSMVAQADGQP